MIKSYIEKRRMKKYVSLVTRVKSLNGGMITESTRSLKKKFNVSKDRIEKLAILVEMSKRFLSKTPFDVQLVAALAMHDGYVLNMLTGEGKTIAGALAAALFASEDKQVVVTTANDYLSQRDAVMMSPLFNAVGIESGVLGQNAHASVMFKSLVGGCLDWLNSFIAKDSQDIYQNSIFKKDNTVMIIDEIDYSLIELSMSPVHIVDAKPSEYNPNFMHALVLKCGYHDGFCKTTKHGQYELTDAFFEFADQFLIHELKVGRDELNSTHYNRFIEFQNAYIAQYVLMSGRDYIVDLETSRVKKFNKRTGRSSVGGFESGVLNFLHKKEQLPPPIENKEIITSTLKYYIRSFETVVGMSGTSEFNQMELNKTYGLKVFKIPARVKSKLINHGYALYTTEEQKVKHLIHFVNSRLSQNRPVLLVCEDNSAASKYYDQFTLLNSDVQLLLGEDETSEADLIKSAGKDAKLTITTRMCARGTDIVVEHDDGLSLVVSGLGVTDVDDLQLNGRTARSGKNGEVVFFASANDPLFSGYLVGSSGYKYILLNCQPEQPNDTEIKSDLCVGAVAVVRRVQLECVKAMREQRCTIIAYQSPIEAQLEIMRKKRLELWSVKSGHDYLCKMIDMTYVSDDDSKENAANVLDRFCSISKYHHNVILQVLNLHLTTLWAEHNDNMRMILSDSFSGGAGMDVGKYNNKCHELFNEFAKTLNEKLLGFVITSLHGYMVEFFKESNSEAIEVNGNGEAPVCISVNESVAAEANDLFDEVRNVTA